jgi:hypothetical protein
LAFIEETICNLLDLKAKLIEAAKVLDLATLLPREGSVQRCIVDQTMNAVFSVEHAKPNAAPPETDKPRLIDARK